MNARLSLDVIDVRTPCPSEWDRMAGDERSRFCAGCGLHVHNLSAMTRTDAERLVCQAAGRLCVRYERTAGGGVRTLDYAEPATGRRGGRFWSALGVAGALAATAAAALVGMPRQANVVMGAIPMFSNPALPPPVAPAGPPSPDEVAQSAGWPLCETGTPVSEEVAPIPQGPPAPAK